MVGMGNAEKAPERGVNGRIRKRRRRHRGGEMGGRV